MRLNNVIMATLMLFALVATGVSAATVTDMQSPTVERTWLAHGGGLNACGCHFNRKTGDCHCHRPRACGCACQPASCAAAPVDRLGEEGYSAVSMRSAVQFKNYPVAGK